MPTCIVLAVALLTLIVSAKGSGDVSELQIGIKQEKRLAQVNIAVEGLNMLEDLLLKPKCCKFKPKSCEIQAQNNDRIRVHYEGMLTDGTVFDSSYEVDEPIKFRLGRGRVIKGWDLGLLGMCLGERRRLKIPPKLAYGDRGKPPRIPRGATLIFDTQLVSVNGIYFDPDED